MKKIRRKIKKKIKNAQQIPAVAATTPTTSNNKTTINNSKGNNFKVSTIRRQTISEIRMICTHFLVYFTLG